MRHCMVAGSKPPTLVTLYSAANTQDGPRGVAGRHTGIETRLPEMAASPAVTSVQALRIVRLHPPHGAGKRLTPLRHGQQVDVICHATPAKNVEALNGRVVCQKSQVFRPVLVGEEDVLPVVAARGDVKK